MPIDQVFGIHADARAVEVSPGLVRRTLVWGERTQVVEFTVPGGTGIPRHQHVHEQVGYVVLGSLEITIGGQTRILGPGDAYLIPSNVAHYSRALEDSVVVDVFSPVRKELN